MTSEIQQKKIEYLHFRPHVTHRRKEERRRTEENDDKRRRKCKHTEQTTQKGRRKTIVTITRWFIDVRVYFNNYSMKNSKCSVWSRNRAVLFLFKHTCTNKSKEKKKKMTDDLRYRCTVAGCP